MRTLWGIAVLLFAIGCATTPTNPDQLYSEGMDDVQADSGLAKVFLDCQTAGQKLRLFVAKSPYDQRAPLAQKRLAECFVQEKNWAEAEQAYRTFVALYPGHRFVPEALMGQAQATYEQRESLDRDPTKLRNALALYSRVIRDFPKNPAAKAAVPFYNEIRNALAEHSWNVGRYYERMRKPLAAYQRYEATALLYYGTEFGDRAAQDAKRLAPNYPSVRD